MSERRLFLICSHVYTDSLSKSDIIYDTPYQIVTTYDYKMCVRAFDIEEYDLHDGEKDKPIETYNI